MVESHLAPLTLVLEDPVLVTAQPESLTAPTNQQLIAIVTECWLASLRNNETDTDLTTDWYTGVGHHTPR